MSTRSADTVTPTAGAPPGVKRPGLARSGLSVRRWVLIAAPVLAGLFAIVGAAADPAVGEDGRALFEAYAANPDPLQWKSVGLHYSYAFWLLPPILLAGYVRGRGVWLANIGALLGWLGLTTIPGFLPVDFYDSALTQVAGAETTQRVSELIETTMWGLPAIVVPGSVGFMLALPVAAAAAWRAGLVRWWAPLAVVAGFLAFGMSNVTWWGCAIMTVFYAVFAAEVARGTARPAPA
ncbi:hypothetical protein BH20ACT6_BH20ACT6_02700 [soil metagenome]